MLFLVYFVMVAVVFVAEWTLSHVREVRMFCRSCVVMQYYQVLAEKWLKANVSCFLMVFNGFSNIYEPQLGIQQRIVFLLHWKSAKIKNRLQSGSNFYIWTWFFFWIHSGNLGKSSCSASSCGRADPWPVTHEWTTRLRKGTVHVVASGVALELY